MTNIKNTIKPFYIEYESSMADSEVQSTFDKAIKAGAILLEDTSSFDASDWKYFGVDYENYTIFLDGRSDFSDYDATPLATEITLSQVDHWLEFGCLDEAPPYFDKDSYSTSKQETPSPDTITSVEDKVTPEGATDSKYFSLESLQSLSKQLNIMFQVCDGKQSLFWNEMEFNVGEDGSLCAIVDAITYLTETEKK